MDTELSRPFIEATIHILQTMASTQPVPGRPAVTRGDWTWVAVTGAIGMAGDRVSGNLQIGFDKPSILGIANRMLMEQFTEINGQVLDAVGELINLIAGEARRSLSERGLTFHIAPPMMITGSGLEIRQLSKVPLCVIPFSTPDGKFIVEAPLFKTLQ